MEKAILVDIDGTLADCEHRRHHVQKSPKDWKSFFAGVSDDKPNSWCVDLIEAYAERADIVLVSGRSEDLRKETETWLETHDIPFHKLYMRASGDFRSDVIVKGELFDSKIKGRWRVLFSVDDRKSVVDMWRSKGIVCLQCDEGDF